MEIHRFEKFWLVGSLILIVGFIATITYGSVAAGVTMVSDTGGTIEPGNFDGTGFEDPGVTHTGGDQYDVYIVAQQFYFNPGSSEPIRVPEGSTVTMYITSPDVVHGFEVAGTNINVMAIPGQVSRITVEFEEPGEYGIVCNEYCGSGHHTMAGELRVAEGGETASFERRDGNRRALRRWDDRVAGDVLQLGPLDATIEQPRDDPRRRLRNSW